jgi:dTDP-glucose 4,6-dehydratase
MGTTLVTGGCGFIGSNFVNLLARCEPDERIVVLDAFTYAAWPENIDREVLSSFRFALVRGDIRDRKLVAQLVQHADKVVHFAAESHVARSIHDDLPFFETDVMGTQSVADAVSRNAGHITRFVHISTSEVYGTAASAPMTEDHPLNPCTPYAAAKAGADRLVYAYRTTYNIPTVILRPFNQYGPRQHIEKLVPRFITQALRKEPLTVHGDGLMTRDWIFVEDTCEAVYRALMQPGIDGSVVNVGTGIDTSVIDIANMVLDVVGLPRSNISYLPQRPGQVDRHISSTSQASDLLSGWEAKTILAQGIEQTVRWYAENPSWWQRLLGSETVDVTDHRRRISGSY